MAHNILITAAAQRDLDDIFEYINEKFLAPQAAINTLSNIKLSILKIAEMPEIGIDVFKRLHKKFKISETLRMIPAGNYLVFYIISDQDLVILRVLYQRRNWLEIFG
ncbi:type II toxin-antitoxin system RelE/ParE family toxin (plasmid) [Leuconostoc mesenteroides]|uniref:Type II toxin-antitoxin system RelE/ParE family toxin n=1 Tax=Leuconostoc kimchii TaxID=136609 RepID=A0ABX5SGY2_9LACO|nr:MULTISPECIES: type II toxin-antitoxin system RelE/ParE family toxin [Lactobacillaceae]APE77593.1 addiction module toxin RelE [Leuconostoc mesenteroides subsp. jonggajibkimchii]AWV38900.1 RelE/ParE family toxin [Leuconostoc mesenteroides]MCU4665896.1 type II toxin-antitoxin system RelE/ParE family toxin [Leuconostoc mesenteroides]MDB1563149.1 type II toxin-antitoxin system RelE/ParE family toxin [Pediococcus pentosaceus]QAT28645.1 type II toxin-antitoxin system RelE/ParE family toxin [Leucon